MGPLTAVLLLCGLLVGALVLLVLRGSKSLSDQLARLTSEVSLRLEAGLTNSQEAARHVGDRLDNAARVVGEVQNKLGQLEIATQQVHTIGREIASLQESLSAPKFRGGFGELLLENLIAQILPRNFYELQYRFPSGEIVDAIVTTPGGITPIDSKFPLSNFKRILEARSDDERKTARREFMRDVRKHVEAVTKYIQPDRGTFPFALMYIPAENVYYEMIIKEDETGESLLSFAQEKKVFPVSPNTFYIYLQTICVGLRGMRVEEWAQKMDANLQGLKGDLTRFTEEFQQIGGHLKNVRLKYESAEKRLDRFQEKLTTLEAPAESDRLKLVSPPPD